MSQISSTKTKKNRRTKIAKISPNEPIVFQCKIKLFFQKNGAPRTPQRIEQASGCRGNLRPTTTQRFQRRASHLLPKALSCCGETIVSGCRGKICSTATQFRLARQWLPRCSILWGGAGGASLIGSKENQMEARKIEAGSLDTYGTWRAGVRVASL